MRHQKDAISGILERQMRPKRAGYYCKHFVPESEARAMQWGKKEPTREEREKMERRLKD